MFKNDNTAKELNEFIDNLWKARLSQLYDGDYSITLTADGKSVSLALNDITFEKVSEEDILVHLNVENVE